MIQVVCKNCLLSRFPSSGDRAVISCFSLLAHCWPVVLKCGEYNPPKKLGLAKKTRTRQKKLGSTKKNSDSPKKKSDSPKKLERAKKTRTRQRMWYPPNEWSAICQSDCVCLSVRWGKAKAGGPGSLSWNRPNSLFILQSVKLRWNSIHSSQASEESTSEAAPQDAEKGTFGCEEPVCSRVDPGKEVFVVCAKNSG